MGETQFKYAVPLYAFLLKDGSGTVFLRAKDEYLLPLFSSAENARLYRDRAKMECIIAELSSFPIAYDFLRDPPRRGEDRVPCNFIVFDPIDPKPPNEFLTLDRIAFLEAIKKLIQK